MVTSLAGEAQASVFARLLPRMVKKLRAMPEDQLQAHVRQLGEAIARVANGERVVVDALPEPVIEGDMIVEAARALNGERAVIDATASEHHDGHHDSTGHALPAVATS